MTLDNYNWRPITFQGVTFPPALMAISALDAILELDDELGEWLWRFPICCGIRKTAPADRCEKCARRAIDSMLEHPVPVLVGIRERLGEYGFEAEATYHEWITALSQIEALSKVALEECSWSAPSHPRDLLQNQADFERFAAAFNRIKHR